MTKGIARSPVRWLHELRVHGGVAFRAGKQGRDLIAEWPGLGRLTCAHDGSKANFIAVRGAYPPAVDKLRGSQVRGLLYECGGGLALHASAVAVHDRAVLFLGTDGAGKSTAAAEMCLGHGARMLADDVALLDVREDSAYVLPSEAEHWLTDDSRRALGVALSVAVEGGGKSNVRADRAGDQPCRLSLVVLLRFESGVRTACLQAMRGSEAARSLLEAALRFDLEDLGARCRELEQVATVYRGACFLELVRPSRDPPGVSGFVMDGLRSGTR